jgi:acetyl esterase
VVAARAEAEAPPGRVEPVAEVRDVAGLPPAYVLTVGYDVLRDEGRAYADRLAAAGVPVRHRRWDGHLHGFLGDPDTYDDAEPALAEITAAVRAALTG